ncbi:MAG TPA: hypothetical protein PK916_06420 [Bacteroidota bacterium]|nr:hypothetical protein [Bacteroidota bacterium]
MTSRIALLSLLLCFCLACDDDADNVQPDRFAYYIIGGEGLHRQWLYTHRDETVFEGDVRWLSTVADNGIVLFRSHSAVGMQLWGRCDNGSILAVPMPISSDVQREALLDEAEPALSRAGHHAAFVVWDKLKTSTDSSAWSARICVFDCAAWRMESADVTAFLRERFPAELSEAFRLRCEAVWLSADGATALLGIIVVQAADSNLRNFAALLRYRNGQLETFPGYETFTDLTFTRYNIFDPATGVLYASAWNEQGRHLRTLAFDATSLGVREVGFVPYFEHASHRVTAGSSEYIDWNSSEVLLRPIAGGLSATELLPFTAVVQDLSISPDAAWFAMRAKTTENDDAWIVAQRGGGIQRVIARGKLSGPLALSRELSNPR